MRSFPVDGKGIVVIGDLLDGHAKSGDYITFNTKSGEITLQIAAVEIDQENASLTFIYKGPHQKKQLHCMDLPMQVVDIIGK